MESAGSSKLEAWLTGSEFVLSLKPLASSEYPFWLTARYLFFDSLPNYFSLVGDQSM
jgi:hypothetical protein